MNNKGFSLVELLAVIALLAVILLIFTPNISKMISDFRENDQIDMLKSSAISAAKEYVVDGNLSGVTFTCNSEIDIENSDEEESDDEEETVIIDNNIISVSALIDSKYLGANDWYNSEHKIKFKYDCNNKKITEYKYCIKIDEKGTCIEK